jgi:hypothetical protein
MTLEPRRIDLRTSQWARVGGIHSHCGTHFALLQSKTDAESAIRRLVVVDGEIEVEKKIGKSDSVVKLSGSSKLPVSPRTAPRDCYHLTQDCTPFNPSHRDTCSSTCAFRYAMSKVFGF